MNLPSLIDENAPDPELERAAIALLMLSVLNAGWCPPQGPPSWHETLYLRAIARLVTHRLMSAGAHQVTRRGQLLCDKLCDQLNTHINT